MYVWVCLYTVAKRIETDFLLIKRFLILNWASLAFSVKSFHWWVHQFIWMLNRSSDTFNVNTYTQTHINKTMVILIGFCFDWSCFFVYKDVRFFKTFFLFSCCSSVSPDDALFPTIFYCLFETIALLFIGVDRSFRSISSYHFKRWYIRTKYLLFLFECAWNSKRWKSRIKKNPRHKQKDEKLKTIQHRQCQTYSFHNALVIQSLYYIIITVFKRYKIQLCVLSFYMIAQCVRDPLPFASNADDKMTLNSFIMQMCTVFDWWIGQ